MPENVTESEFPVGTGGELFGSTGERDLARLLSAPETCDPAALLSAVVEVVDRCYPDEAIDRVELRDYSVGTVVREDGSRVALHVVTGSDPLDRSEVARLREISRHPEVLVLTLSPLERTARTFVESTDGVDYAALSWD